MCLAYYHHRFIIIIIGCMFDVYICMTDVEIQRSYEHCEHNEKWQPLNAARNYNGVYEDEKVYN